jgi:hypothetical protein
MTTRGRPYRQTEFVYRVQTRRPQTGDSMIRWLTISPPQIREKYGDTVMSIQRFKFDSNVMKRRDG